MAAHARRSTRHAAAPAFPRRTSGPVRPAVTTRPVGQTTSGSLRAVRALPDNPLLDKLLTSRAWIWLIGIALGGIVAMQVSLLKMNAGISRAVETATTIERQNALLSEQVAVLSSGERVRAAAIGLGLISPRPGSVEYVRARSLSTDARRAVSQMHAPSEQARQLLASGGRPLVTAPVTTTQTTPVTTTTGTTAASTAPAATTEPAAPVSTAPTPTTSSAEGGGAAAPATGG